MKRHKREPGGAAHSPSEVLPLTPAVFHILVALGDGERHGYAIMQEVARLTEGRTQLGPGTLYRSIQRMLAEGLISESTTRPGPELDDERRRYYRLTEFGLQVASAEAERLCALVAAARNKGILPAPQGGYII
jgi:DNA-binding PadR family transcriptional regulator